MTGASLVLICALELLGRSPESLPPIKLVDQPIAGTMANLEAYVLANNPTIYVITSTDTFRRADCSDRGSLVKLASVIAHEEWHVKKGLDEKGAYQAQLMSLMLMGVGPDTGVYLSVQRAMRFALSEEGKAALRTLGSSAVVAASTASSLHQPD
jgi:hypothetical protein